MTINTHIQSHSDTNLSQLAHSINNCSAPNLKGLMEPLSPQKQQQQHNGSRHSISQSDSNIDSVVLDNWSSNHLPREKCLKNFSPINNGSNDNFRDEDQKKFPSPPLSPKLRPTYHRTEPSYSLLPTNDTIMVTPNWKLGQKIKNYRHDTRAFLLRYRLFNDNERMGNNNINNNRLTRIEGNNNFINGINGQTHYLRNIYRDGMVSSNEGLRRSLLRHYYRGNTGHNDRPSSSLHRKSASPNYHHRHKFGGTSSPPPNIASLELISKAPQYIPNVSWAKLPDYSPPIESLPPNNNKCLKVEWKGSPLNLSQDPLKSHLHLAELYLASILRLPCDLYMDSKRRLFLEKVCKLQMGLPFRRTDAQKACRIDVNKASRLYSAFEKVGWLNDDNFVKYLK